MGPRVSKAKGTKQYAGKIAMYLADFLSGEISAAAPAASADLACARLCQGADDSSVPSQVPAALPWDKGCTVWAFPIGSDKTDWLSCRRETGFDKATPSDVIYESVPSSSTVSKAT